MREAQLANANPQPMNAMYVARVAAGSRDRTGAFVLSRILTVLRLVDPDGFHSCEALIRGASAAEAIRRCVVPATPASIRCRILPCIPLIRTIVHIIGQIYTASCLDHGRGPGHGQRHPRR